jgi:hypothetical protein
MGKFQMPSDSEFYTPSSESIRLARSAVRRLKSAPTETGEMEGKGERVYALTGISAGLAYRASKLRLDSEAKHVFVRYANIGVC